MTHRQLAAAVLQAVDSDSEQGARPTDDPEILGLLEAKLRQSEQSWPGITIDQRAWAAFVAGRLSGQGDLGATLEKLRLDDLYLCCACLQRDEVALQAFHERFLPAINATLRQLRVGDGLRSDLAQQLVVQLLVGDQDREPMLGRYAGLGRLSGWLRVVAARTTRKRLHRERRVVLSDDERIEEELIGEQSDLPWLKRQYREAFRAAFKEALGQLDHREGNLLRYRYVDCFGLDQIGGVYRVHGSTVHRWLERVRQRLLELTNERLAAQLKIPKAECSTIIRMIQSDFDMTLHTLFGSRDGGDGATQP